MLSKSDMHMRLERLLWELEGLGDVMVESGVTDSRPHAAFARVREALKQVIHDHKTPRTRGTQLELHLDETPKDEQAE